MERGVVFSMQERLFAVPLEATVRVLRAVDITRIPEAAPEAPGVIDVHGVIMPVVDLRPRFGLPQRALVPAAQFLLVDTARRPVALWVDRVHGVADWHEGEFTAADGLVPGGRPLKGIARSEDGLVLVQDLDALLASIDELMAAEAGGDG